MLKTNKLSNQAKWYLTGLQRTLNCKESSIEPSAKEELESGGYITRTREFITGEYFYTITGLGIEENLT